MIGAQQGPWIELATGLPLAASAAIGFVKRTEWKWAASSLTAIAVLVLAVIAWSDFLTARADVAPGPRTLTALLFGRDLLVVDRFNSPLLVLAALLFVAVILLTPSSKRARFSFGQALLLLGLTIALLGCHELKWYIVLLGAQAILPIIELRQRRQAFGFFAAHQIASLLLLTAGALASGTGSAGEPASIWGVALISAGLMIRCGCAPLHCWIVDLLDRASLGTGLLYLTPLAGTCGFVRFVLPVAPAGLLQAITVLSLFTAIYASGMVLVQASTRRFFCYLFLANSSLVLVGLESLSPIGLTGSMSLWLSATISVLSLGVIIRAVEGRVGRVSLLRYHGLFRQMPLLAVFFLIAVLASIGFPGTVGFAGVELLVESALESSPLYGCLVVAAMALNGIAALRAYFRLFTGTTAPATISMQPRPIEQGVIFVFTVLIIAGGLYPQPGVMNRYEAATELIEHRQSLLEAKLAAAPFEQLHLLADRNSENETK